MEKFETNHAATDSLWCYFRNNLNLCELCKDDAIISLHGGHLGDLIIHLCDDCSGMLVSVVDRLEPWVDPVFSVEDREAKFIVILELLIAILNRKEPNQNERS